MKQTDQDTAETLKVEKIIQKLETLDIREWKYHDCTLTAEASGMQFQIYGGRKYVTALSIKNMESSTEFEEYFNSKKIKNLTKVLENLYNKIYASLQKYEKERLTEKLDSFLSE